jgi:hypothetical protein
LSVLGVGHNGGRNRHGEGPNPMENAIFLRRQAVFCLRLSQLCPDALVVDHLTRKAAQYHEEALRTEFEVELDPGERGRVLTAH